MEYLPGAWTNQNVAENPYGFLMRTFLYNCKRLLGDSRLGDHREEKVKYKILQHLDVLLRAHQGSMKDQNSLHRLVESTIMKNISIS